MLRVSHVYKYFGDVCVNDDISLEVKSGSIIGLLGPNGAGKTTLMRMLSTVTTPDRGEIFFNDSPINQKIVSQIGYMPEERGLYRKMTVVDQLLYFAELKGMSRTSAKENVKYWMNKLDIISWADKKMEELSKGMAQKVQFISTILHKPKFLILDEPFSGFDPVNADLVKDLIIELKNEGATIIFSTHRMDNVEELCDQIAIIHQGKKKLDGEISEVRRSFRQNEFDITFNEDVAIPETYNIQLTKMELSGKTHRVKLSENQKSTELLQWAFNTGKLIAFKEHIPSIHQIFVNQVS